MLQEEMTEIVVKAVTVGILKADPDMAEAISGMEMVLKEETDVMVEDRTIVLAQDVPAISGEDREPVQDPAENHLQPRHRLPIPQKSIVRKEEIIARIRIRGARKTSFMKRMAILH